MLERLPDLAVERFSTHSQIAGGTENVQDAGREFQTPACLHA
jgi:hypothetical protein